MPRPLNIRQVEAFRSVMLTGSMTAAAEMMSVTQPAVSRLIKDFERATALLLFERHGNQVVPTREAVTLMKEVQRSYIGLGRIAAAAEDIGRHWAGSLRIAAMPALANGVLPRFLAKFVGDKPQLQVALVGLTSSLVIESVAAGQADLGFADGPFDRPGFNIVNRPSAAVVALPVGHPLAARQLLTPQDLAGERLISLEPGSLFAQRVDVALAGVTRTGLLETRLSHSALTLVQEGAGVALVDAASVLDFAGRGVVARSFSVFIDGGYVEIRRADSGSSRIVDVFSEGFNQYLTGQITP